MFQHGTQHTPQHTADNIASMSPRCLCTHGMENLLSEATVPRKMNGLIVAQCNYADLWTGTMKWLR